MTNDPLMNLIVDDAEQVNRASELLAIILKPYIEIYAQSGQISLLPQVYELPPKEQILVLLCGRLAQKYLNKLQEGEDEKLSQTEIMRMLPTLPEGTIKSYLKELRDNLYIANEDRKNYVSLGHLSKIQKRLNLLKK